MAYGDTRPYEPLPVGMPDTAIVQNPTEVSNAPSNRIYLVDRDDPYTPDGSIFRPFRTIAQVADFVNENVDRVYEVVIEAASFTANVTFTTPVTIRGAGFRTILGQLTFDHAEGISEIFDCRPSKIIAADGFVYGHNVVNVSLEPSADGSISVDNSNAVVAKVGSGTLTIKNSQIASGTITTDGDLTVINSELAGALVVTLVNPNTATITFQNCYGAGALVMKAGLTVNASLCHLPGIDQTLGTYNAELSLPAED